MGETEPIEIQTTAAHDWTWAVVGSVIFLTCAYVLATTSATEWATPSGVKGEWLILLVDKEFGVTAVRLLTAVFGLGLGCEAIGALWRLKDGRRVLMADRAGIAIHPSFCPRRLRWSDLESVTLAGRHPSKIVVRLKRRFWSLTWPLTSRTVELNLWAIGSTYRHANACAVQMRRWMKS
jgi:hypothetical protein